MPVGTFHVLMSVMTSAGRGEHSKDGAHAGAGARGYRSSIPPAGAALKQQRIMPIIVFLLPGLPVPSYRRMLQALISL